ncbi:MAG: hypothetical protein HC916_20035 [Coleofasciculaceae cyanobacterium SM2_1_6]|nr:hypothetical protein [Coleofasciculaceae cyanobacterium SM2_1_6]
MGDPLAETLRERDSSELDSLAETLRERFFMGVGMATFSYPRIGAIVL